MTYELEHIGYEQFWSSGRKLNGTRPEEEASVADSRQEDSIRVTTVRNCVELVECAACS